MRLWFGRYRGRFPEEVMLLDYPYMAWLRTEVCHPTHEFFIKMELGQHPYLLGLRRLTGRLIFQGEDRPVRVKCVKCQKNYVEKIGVKGTEETEIIMGQELVFCSDCFPYEECQSFQPRFAKIMKFEYHKNRTRFQKLLLWVLGFEGEVTAEKAKLFFTDEKHDWQFIYQEGLEPIKIRPYQAELEF